VINPPKTAYATRATPVNALDSAMRNALVKFFPRLSKVRLLDYKVRIVNSTAGTGAEAVRELVQDDGLKIDVVAGVVVEAEVEAGSGQAFVANSGASFGRQGDRILRTSLDRVARAWRVARSYGRAWLGSQAQAGLSVHRDQSSLENTLSVEKSDQPGIGLDPVRQLPSGAFHGSLDRRHRELHSLGDLLDSHRFQVAQRKNQPLPRRLARQFLALAMESMERRPRAFLIRMDTRGHTRRESYLSQ